MPDRKTTKKAEADRREGKSASTQAGEFVRDEIERIRHGEHGARSAKQAASHEALSRQAKRQARKRTPAERSASARKAARTRKAHAAK